MKVFTVRYGIVNEGLLRLGLSLPLLCCSTLPAKAQGGTTGQSASSNNDIIVTARRKSKRLDDAVVIDELASGRIRALGARTVEDLITRLRQQQGGRPFSIIINGRRIGSISDIEELPPEALESIQIYPPAEASRFGYSSTDRLLNISLKDKFASISLEGDGSSSTDGGAESGSVGMRQANLRGDKRLIASLNGRLAAGLSASERPRTSAASERVVDGQSLVPRMLSLSTIFGMSNPVGNGSLDVNIKGDAQRVVRSMNVDRSRQITQIGAVGVNTTYSKDVARFFLTAIGDMSYSRERDEIISTSDCAVRFSDLCPKQDLTTTKLSASLALILSGQIATLPAGDVRLDSTVKREFLWTKATGWNLGGSESTRYGRTVAQLVFRLPIFNPEIHHAGFLGSLEINPSFDYNAVDFVGGAAGFGLAGIWSFSESFNINGSVSRRAAPPSSDQLNGPSRTIVGITVYDYRTNALVPIDQLTGGAPLRSQYSREERISADYNFHVGKVAGSASIGYARATIINPILTLVEPSVFLENVFPERFIRNTAGVLIRVDARPLTAQRQALSTLSSSFNLSGGWGRSSDPEGGTLNNWTVGVQYEAVTRQSLKIAENLPEIDTLRNPISLSSGTLGPRRWSAQAGLQAGWLGANLSAVLVNGLRSTLLGDSTRSMRVAPLARIDANIFANVSWRSHQENSSAVRIELSVKNLLNARPKIAMYSEGRVVYLNKWQLDPLGRTIALSLRLPLSR